MCRVVTAVLKHAQSQAFLSGKLVVLSTRQAGTFHTSGWDVSHFRRGLFTRQAGSTDRWSDRSEWWHDQPKSVKDTTDRCRQVR